MPPIFRFAPSPNGFLHRGHAYSAWLNSEMARETGGRFLLRIEDIDSTRCRPDYEQALYDDLAWLGLFWERPVRRQSEHMSNYRNALATLQALDIVYPCRCTRADILETIRSKQRETASPWPLDPNGAPLYPGTCRGTSIRTSGGAYALRLDMKKALHRSPALSYRRFVPGGNTETVEARPALWGDVVLARKDIGTSYHIAVVTDDALQGITHIVRGADLETATDLHVLLQFLLTLPSPLYHHHALMTDTSGTKLSKSLGSLPLACLRAQGVMPQEILKFRSYGHPARIENGNDLEPS